MSVDKLNIELDSLVFINQWILNNNIDKVELDKIEKGNTIELKDNFEYDNKRSKDTKLITSQFSKIALKNGSKYKLPIVIYNLLNKTSINNESILNYEDMNDKILEILLYLIKNKFIYKKYKAQKSFNLKKNENLINTFSNIIDNCSSEDILENMIRLFDMSGNKRDEFRLFFNINSDEIGNNTKTEGLNDYNFNKSSTSISRRYLYNFISYKYINQAKYNISNNYLLFFKIFDKINNSFNTKKTIKNNIKIKDIFLFCKNPKYSTVQSEIEKSFNFDDIMDNVKTFNLKYYDSDNIYIHYNEVAGTATNVNEYIHNQLYYNDIKVTSISKDNKGQFKSNLLINENTKLIRSDSLDDNKFGEHMALLFNIICDDTFTRKLMYSKSYKANKIIALEKYLCILFQIFMNIRTVIDKFIKDIIPVINLSDLENKKIITDYIYDLKRIYTFKNIFSNNLEFIYTSNEDYDKVIYNSETRNNKIKEDNNVRINNFYNKCNNDSGFMYNIIEIVKYMGLFKRNKELVITFENDKLKKEDRFDSTKEIKSDENNYLINEIFINYKKVGIQDKMIKGVYTEYNPYGLINILNLIINKNSTHHNGLQLIHDKNDDSFKKKYTNCIQILNKYITRLSYKTKY